MLHAPSMYLTIMKEMSQQLQSYLCVNAATETTHVECVSEDDVRGAFTHPRGQNCPQEGDSVFVGQKRVRVCNWGRSTGANGTQPSWPQMIRYQQEYHCVPTPSFTFGMHGVRHNGVEQVFSATPPLEALRVFGVARQEDVPQVADPLLITIADVNRAHFNADAVRNVYVRLTEEASVSKDPGKCGKISKDYARNLQRCSTMERALCTGLRRRRIRTRFGIPVPLRRPCTR